MTNENAVHRRGTNSHNRIKINHIARNKTQKHKLQIQLNGPMFTLRGNNFEKKKKRQQI